MNSFLPIAHFKNYQLMLSLVVTLLIYFPSYLILHPCYFETNHQKVILYLNISVGSLQDKDF